MITDEQTKELEKSQVFQWVAIKAAIVEEGNLLLGKRLDQDDHGLYEIPGGKLEVGEDLEKALFREVFEETGVEVQSQSVGKAECNPITVVQYQEKIIFLVVLANVVNKEEMMKDSEELGEIGFYTKEEVKKMIEEKSIRPVYNGLAQMFIQGELEK